MIRSRPIASDKGEIFEPMIAANDKESFIKPGRHREPALFSRQLYLKLCPLTVIDKETLKLIQVLQLHMAIDYTRSAKGSAVLLRSLIRPRDIFYAAGPKSLVILDEPVEETTKSWILWPVGSLTSLMI